MNNVQKENEKDAKKNKNWPQNESSMLCGKIYYVVIHVRVIHNAVMINLLFSGKSGARWDSKGSHKVFSRLIWCRKNIFLCKKYFIS